MENEHDTYLAYARYISQSYFDNTPSETEDPVQVQEMYNTSIKNIMGDDLIGMVSDNYAVNTAYSGRIANTSQLKTHDIIRETLINLKLGLKPYYQQKISYPTIEEPNNGIYIEYIPDEAPDLTGSQKIEWMLPSLVNKINKLHEAKEKAYADYAKANREFEDTITDLNRAIESYKENGHNYIL